jgi:hypothetical protein
MKKKLIFTAAFLVLTLTASAHAEPAHETGEVVGCRGKVSVADNMWLGHCGIGADSEAYKQILKICPLGSECAFTGVFGSGNYVVSADFIERIEVKTSGKDNIYICKGFVEEEHDILTVGVNESTCEVPKNSDVARKIEKACGNEYCRFTGIGPDHRYIKRIEGSVNLVVWHCHGTLKVLGDDGVKIIGADARKGDDDVCASIDANNASYVLDDPDGMKLLLRICKDGDTCDFDLGLHHNDGTFIVGRIRNAGVQQHKTSSSNSSPPLDFISKDVTACPTIAEVTPEGCNGHGTLKLEKDQPVFVLKRVSPDGETGAKFACVSNANSGRCYWLSSDYLTGETPVFGPVYHGRATCSRCRE